MASLPRSYQRKRRVEERDHDISHSQVHDEQAGGGVHALGLDDNVTDQDVAEEGEDDDEGVRRDQQGFHRDALRLRSVPAPAHKALPVGQAVVVPGEETRDVRDYKRLLQAPIEWQLSGGRKGINQVKEGEPDKTGQHLQNAALLLQFGNSSFAIANSGAELTLCAGRAVLPLLQTLHTSSRSGGCSCLPQPAALPAVLPLLFLLQPVLYPHTSSKPVPSAAIGLHDIISALTCCFSTQSCSPECYSKISTAVRKAKSVSPVVSILLLYQQPSSCKFCVICKPAACVAVLFSSRIQFKFKLSFKDLAGKFQPIDFTA